MVFAKLAKGFSGTLSIDYTFISYPIYYSLYAHLFLLYHLIIKIKIQKIVPLKAMKTLKDRTWAILRNFGS